MLFEVNSEQNYLLFVVSVSENDLNKLFQYASFATTTISNTSDKIIQC